MEFLTCEDRYIEKLLNDKKLLGNQIDGMNQQIKFLMKRSDERSNQYNESKALAADLASKAKQTEDAFTKLLVVSKQNEDKVNETLAALRVHKEEIVALRNTIKELTAERDAANQKLNELGKYEPKHAALEPHPAITKQKLGKVIDDAVDEANRILAEEKLNEIANRIELDVKRGYVTKVMKDGKQFYVDAHDKKVYIEITGSPNMLQAYDELMPKFKRRYTKRHAPISESKQTDKGLIITIKRKPGRPKKA